MGRGREGLNSGCETADGGNGRWAVGSGDYKRVQGNRRQTRFGVELRVTPNGKEAASRHFQSQACAYSVLRTRPTPRALAYLPSTPPPRMPPHTLIIHSPASCWPQCVHCGSGCSFGSVPPPGYYPMVHIVVLAGSSRGLRPLVPIVPSSMPSDVAPTAPTSLGCAAGFNAASMNPLFSERQRTVLTCVCACVRERASWLGAFPFLASLMRSTSFFCVYSRFGAFICGFL